MSDDNLNISQLKADYPFLNEIWNLYDNFDKSVGESGYNGVYRAICDNVTHKLGDDKERYYPFCLKLIRNLDPYCENQEVCILPSTRCNHVNNWLYNSKDKKNHNNKYINRDIFNLSGTIRPEIRNYACSYYSYDENYEDPINIIRLRIFGDNIDVIKSILEKKSDPNNSSAQGYLCKFVQLHKKMYRSYCSDKPAKNHKEERTCGELDTLKRSYDTFLLGKQDISDKVPSLDAKEPEPLHICPPDKSELLLQDDDHSGSSTSKIPATIGTMAGVSSVFALLYNLTPAGRWINTGLRGSGGRINNSLYTNGADDLILDGLEHNNFNSYNMGYEAT
ncbi:PIR protein [Plasmodium vivax]|nr:PIR protein [Plasmodium vivax]